MLRYTAIKILKYKPVFYFLWSRLAVMKITRLSLWIRMPSLGMWLVRLFSFPFSLIKSTYCARSSVLCNILHACNLSTSENFHICHAVMCVIFFNFLICFQKHTRVFRGFCLESHWSMHINSVLKHLIFLLIFPLLTSPQLSYLMCRKWTCWHGKMAD